MNTKVCKQCQAQFMLEADDLNFLDQISPEINGAKITIPSPSLCPECRQKRRMSFRNERNLYLRKCDITGKDIFSIFPPDSRFKVCDKDYWWSDKFDPIQYGRPYNPSKTFFEQFYEFSKDIPLPSLRVEKSENSDFNNDVGSCTDCYLCARTHSCQNCHYTYRGNHSNDCVDCIQVVDSELLYGCVECVKCNGCNFCNFCGDCSSSSFLIDCRGCNNCFLSSNLRNKQYYFKNQSFSKDEYEKKIAEYNLGTYAGVSKAIADFDDIKLQAIYKNLNIVNSENCTGDNIVDSKNCRHCFGLKFSEDSSYLWDVMRYKNSMDAYSGGRDSELIYETTAVANSYGCSFCLRATESRNVQYSYFIRSSKNIFGCIGLNHKEFCILNVQYSEGEYNELLAKIIQKMKEDGEYGEFFPTSMSLFAYNDTVANDFFHLTKDQAISKGYHWRDIDPKEYSPATRSTPDDIKSVGEDILKEVLSCECDECLVHEGKRCGKNYKINPMELAFYLKQSLTLPHKCPDCRFRNRQKIKNPMRLRKGICSRCNKYVETTYPENFKPKIYCENCYREAIY